MEKEKGDLQSQSYVDNTYQGCHHELESSRKVIVIVFFDFLLLGCSSRGLPIEGGLEGWKDVDCGHKLATFHT